MKLYEILSAPKLKAAQKKIVANRVKNIKFGDEVMTRSSLIRLEDEAVGHPDEAVIMAVVKEIRDWMTSAREEYEKLSKDVQGLEERTKVYLFDAGVDHENVIDAGIAEDDVRYWPEMLRSAQFSIPTRAEEANIDLKAELGYSI